MPAATAQSLPGVRFEAQAPPLAVSPLRTDIAGFVGPTRRGPLQRVVRVDGWRQYQEVFGGLTQDYDTAFALRGYFENGGELAYVIRALGAGSSHARGWWTVGTIDGGTQTWAGDAPAAGGFEAARYRIEAATPGVWANGLQVSFEYRRRGQDGTPEVSIDVRSGPGPDQDREVLTGLAPDNLVQLVAERSRLIRLRVDTPAPLVAAAHDGPRALRWTTVILGQAVADQARELPPTLSDYLPAVEPLMAQREVALLAVPDLARIAGPRGTREQLLATLAAGAEARHDRQILAALDPDQEDSGELLEWLRHWRAGLDESQPRSMTFYHPWLRVPDPLGGVVRPLRDIAPVGHVAGMISRLDRERGVQYTPANARLFDAMDLSLAYSADEQAAQAMAGINPLRCIHGQGLMVWGGRTAWDPALGHSGLFLAHRRLIHRLVRAIRRVAAPLVFENNGPALWLNLVRGVTTVLLEAYRAGALKGERAEQAFRVRCDESTNPPASRDQGRVVTEIQLAPAVPMEFITLRVAVSRDDPLEVIEP